MSERSRPGNHGGGVEAGKVNTEQPPDEVGLRLGEPGGAPASVPPATGEDPRSAQVLVRMSGIAKAFGATKALRDASFELAAGEVHVLAGENGSGKSTLVKILSGIHVPDAGEIELSGEIVNAMRTPREAQRRGIVTVLQEVLVVEARSVLENVWLGVDHALRRRVPLNEKRARARERLQQLLERPPDLDSPVEDLSLSERQACCIVRALLREPAVLVLDEATSALDIATRDRLFGLIRALRDEGLGVVFITHRMDEITEIGDRITVLRSGATAGTLQRGAWTPGELVRLMTGSERLTQQRRTLEAAAASSRARPVLSVRGLRLRPSARPFDVEIRAGEFVGVAGLEGHGQDAFLDALRGLGGAGGHAVRHTTSGDAPVRSTRDAAKRGIAFVPRERRQAMFGWMSIRENFGMPTLTRDSLRGLLRPGRTRGRLRDYVERLNIVMGNEHDRITTLSGGNQQKVIIARWLAATPQILLLNDPTRGIDIGAKRDLYRLLTQLSAEGIAIVMLSTELDEHVELMDRVFVFREHELSREIQRADISRGELVAAFFGTTERSGQEEG